MTDDDHLPRPTTTGRRRAHLLRLLLALLATVLVAETAARAVVPGALPEPLEWASWPMSAQAGRMQAQGADGPAGMVLIGSSQTHRLDPTLLAQSGVATTAYNASVNGGEPRSIRRWVLEQVVPTLRPERVLWGLSIHDINANLDAELAGGYDEARATRRGLLADLDRWAARRSVLVEHRPQLRSVSAALLAHSQQATEATRTDPIALDGMQAGRLGYAMGPGVRPRQHMRHWRPSQDAIDAIGSLATALQDQGIELVLVLLPTSDRAASVLPGGPADRDRGEDLLRDLATSLGVTTVDLTGSLRDDGGYSDAEHLTPEASLVATEAIARALGGTPPTDRPDAPRIAVRAASGETAPLLVESVALVRDDVLELRLPADRPATLRVFVTVVTATERHRVVVDLLPGGRKALVETTSDDGAQASVATPVRLTDPSTVRVRLTPAMAAAAPDVVRVRSLVPGTSQQSQSESIRWAALIDPSTAGG